VALPSIAELKQPTLELLAGGVADSDEMRRRIAQDWGIDPVATPRFTNNHAWTLVRLQQEDLIQKLGLKAYIITKKARDFSRGLKRWLGVLGDSQQSVSLLTQQCSRDSKSDMQ
jgi:hypothetical protein